MIKAFTILEVVIAMLISALVIGMTYNAYLIISRSYISFVDKNNRLAEITLTDHLIAKDFIRASKITLGSEGLIFESVSDTLIYKFYDNYIIRCGKRSDTLKVKTTSLTLNFEGRPASTEAIKPYAGLMDDLKFTLIENTDSLLFHYHKTYSSTDLFNSSAHAVN